MNAAADTMNFIGAMAHDREKHSADCRNSHRDSRPSERTKQNRKFFFILLLPVIVEILL